MTGRRFGTHILLGSLLLPAIGSAQEATTHPPCNRTPTESDVAAAKGAFQAGKVSFDEAEYERSIDYWEDAYRRDCTATGLLLNLSRAYELNGNLPAAISSLKEYMERNPDTPKRGQLERRIKFLEDRLAKNPVSGGSKADDDQPNQDRTNADRPEPDPAPSTPPPPESDREDRPIWPLYVAGGGALIGTVGAILYFDASSDVSHYEEICPLQGNQRECPDPQTESAANDANSRATTYGIVTIGGLALLGGGLAWYFLAPTSSDSASRGIELGDSVAMTPVAGPGIAGLEFNGRF